MGRPRTRGFAVLRAVKIAALALLAAVVVLVVAGFFGLRHRDPPMPPLAGTLEHGVLLHAGRERTWLAYVPPRLAARPAVVLVLHASMGSAARARAEFGYDFDRLADRDGFLVVYPQGFDGHWNDVKRRGPFAAKRLHIDDVGFLHALVARLVRERHVDASRVYVTGVSNGGGMTLRLALQTPEFARAYAAVVASVPAPGNFAMRPVGRPVSVLLMNGTADPMNPWGGGDVALYGVWGNRGPVLSAAASIDYLRRLDGLAGPPQVTAYPDRDPRDGSTVRRAIWTAPGRPRLELVSVEGGGHGVPHPQVFGRRLLGHSNRDVHAAEVIWAFFQAAP